MFISEFHITQFQQSSHIYRNLPMALIMYKELARKNMFVKGINVEMFKNFYQRFDSDFLEILFPDSSVLMIKFDKYVCHVYHPRSMYFKEFSIP